MLMESKNKLKICGLKSQQDILIVNQFDVCFAGFIFAKNSIRAVSVASAAKLRAMLRPGIEAVGVFVNTPIDEVNEIALKVGLDKIQLHSDETDKDIQNAIRPVWKMISVKNKEDVENVKKFPSAQGILFDTYHKGLLGGTGKKFEWDYVRHMPAQRFTILAGGLNPDNILEAARFVNPHVLDVNSGVETEGKKDKYKVDLLLRRLRNDIG